MKWPNDADGDVFRRLAKDGFDFNRTHTIEFCVEVDSWPPSGEALALMREFHPDARLHEPEDGYPGYVAFHLTGKLSYELVTSTQHAMSDLMKMFGGVCESWGVLQESEA